MWRILLSKEQCISLSVFHGETKKAWQGFYWKLILVNTIELENSLKKTFFTLIHNIESFNVNLSLINRNIVFKSWMNQNGLNPELYPNLQIFIQQQPLLPPQWILWNARLREAVFSVQNVTKRLEWNSKRLGQFLPSSFLSYFGLPST